MTNVIDLRPVTFADDAWDIIETIPESFCIENVNHIHLERWARAYRIAASDMLSEASFIEDYLAGRFYEDDEEPGAEPEDAA